MLCPLPGVGLLLQRRSTWPCAQRTAAHGGRCRYPHSLPASPPPPPQVPQRHRLRPVFCAEPRREQRPHRPPGRRHRGQRVAHRQRSRGVRRGPGGLQGVVQGGALAATWRAAQAWPVHARLHGARWAVNPAARASWPARQQRLWEMLGGPASTVLLGLRPFRCGPAATPGASPRPQLISPRCCRSTWIPSTPP